MLEFILTAAIIWLGLTFWAADAYATRKWQKEVIERHVIASIRH